MPYAELLGRGWGQQRQFCHILEPSPTSLDDNPCGSIRCYCLDIMRLYVSLIGRLPLVQMDGDGVRRLSLKTLLE